jgi:hypothetical protein
LWISDFAPTSTPCVGSSRISTSGSIASQRASATLLIAAGEGGRIGVEEDALIRSRSRYCPLQGVVPQMARKPCREKPFHVGETTFAETGISRMTPCCRRSSGTYPIPSRIRLPETRYARSGRATECRRNRQEQARTALSPSRVRPDPTRPATPTISPAFSARWMSRKPRPCCSDHAIPATTSPIPSP